jgi:hypothetical protein
VWRITPRRGPPPRPAAIIAAYDAGLRPS